jgi:hypothetical protein
MISEFFLQLAQDITTWLAGFMTYPGAKPQDVWGQMSGLVSQFASLGVWINWAAVAGAVGVALSVWLVCLGIKIVRAIIAHIPAFGGAG